MVQGNTSGDFDFDTDEATGIETYTYADRVKNRLAEMGVTGASARQPVLQEEHVGIFPNYEVGTYFDGSMPTVIRKLNLDQLSALYSLYSNWYAYLSFQTKMVAAERSEALHQREFIWSNVRRQKKNADPTRKISDQAASDLARTDYRYVKANARYEELNVLHQCMEAMLEVTKKNMSVISREVTITQIQLENVATGTNFHNRTGRLQRPQHQEGPDGSSNPHTWRNRARS